MHGCGWESGAARERSSALWLPQRRLALRAWRRWRGRYAPGRPWQPGHCLALRARRRRRGRCAPGRLHVLSAHCARCLLGGSGDVEDVVRCALLERLGARRASSSCRGRGWGGTPRGPCCHRLRHARAEHRYGGSWQEGGARAASPPLQGLAPPARRPRAAGAPWEARARAARVQTAGEDLWYIHSSFFIHIVAHKTTRKAAL